MKKTRREFLVGMVAGSAALGTGRHAGAPILAAERDALDGARRLAAHRRRRIIYNNDGDDVLVLGATTRESFLAQRHTPLLGTQVDSIYYNTTQSFNYFVHQTDVAERFLKTGDPLPCNNLAHFLEQGTDGLRMSCEFARSHGIEVLWTLRMNDIHDVKAPIFVPQWKKENPRRVMAAFADVEKLEDRRALWSLVDFENPEVEPRIIAIIEEVLRNYPVDGVDLDFLRAPFYFRTAYEGAPASETQIGILTRLVENIRKVVVSESERQGKPFLLSSRVPVTEAFCKRIGIDIRHWLEAGWIDTVTLGGGYVPFDQPVGQLIELGHRYAIPVYPCLSRSGLLLQGSRGVKEMQSPAAWHGAAAGLWKAGADGIHVFNLFPNNNVDTDVAVGILKTIGAPETLAESDRMFAISDAGNYLPSHYWAKDVEEYSAALPLPLKAPSTVAPIMIADLNAAAGARLETELRLDFTGVSESKIPTVGWNSLSLGAPTAAEKVAGALRCRYSLPRQHVHVGRNEIHVGAAAGEAQLVGAEFWLRVADN